jgi:hypothetical protein
LEIIFIIGAAWLLPWDLVIDDLHRHTLALVLTIRILTPGM